MLTVPPEPQDTPVERSLKNGILLVGNEIHIITQTASKIAERDDLVSVEHLKPIPWILETKYYTAKLDLIPYIQASESELPKEIQSRVDGLILVMNDVHSKTQILETLEIWSNFTLEGELGVGMVLLNDSDEDYDDYSLEPIVIDMTSPSQPLSNNEIGSLITQEGQAGSETQGWDRVLENLQVNMWDGLVRKSIPSTMKSLETLDNQEISEHVKMTEEESVIESLGYSLSELKSFQAKLFDDDVNVDDPLSSLGNLKSIREQVEDLDWEARKRFAEKFVLSIAASCFSDDECE